MRHLNRFSGIVFLLLAAAASSCINTDNTLGSIYVPSNQDISVEIAEFDLPVTLKLSEEIQSQSSTLMFGSITTSDYGTIKVGAAAAITPALDSVEWGAEPVFKDMFLQGGVSQKGVLSPDQAMIPQNIHVYALNRALDSTLVYANSISKADLAATRIMKGSSIYLGGDSVKVHFTKEFGEQFFKATRNELDSIELFAKRFFGIYIETDPVEEGLTGGRINQMEISSTRAVLEFTSTNEKGERRDTSIIFNVGKPYYCNTFTAESKRLETERPTNTLLYEGLSGVKPHVSAKALRNMIAQWAVARGIDVSRILVAKATIELPFEYSGNYSEIANTYPTNLFPCQRVYDDADKSTLYIPLPEIYNSNVNNGVINRSLLCYKPDAGNYIQGLLKKEANSITEYDDLWLLPTISITNSTTNQVYYYADYFNYNIAKLNGPASKRKPKLRITYSVLK